MISTIAIPVFLWGLAFVLLVVRRSRVRSITYAVMAIALATSLNIDPVYQWLDALIGGKNIGDLVANWSLVAGVFFLARGVAQAYEFSNKAVRILLGPAALTAAAAGMTLAFMFIDAPTTSTRFMADFGDQPAAAAYSIIQYAYLGAAMGAMLRVSWEQARTARGTLRLFTWSLTSGAAISVLLSATVVAMDISNVLSWSGTLRILQTIYDVLWPLAFLVVGFGLAGPPIQRWGDRVAYRRGAHRHSRKVRDVWERAGGDDVALQGLDLLARLEQMIVDTRDAWNRVGRWSAVDEQTVRAAEKHLARRPPMGSGRAPRYS